MKAFAPLARTPKPRLRTPIAQVIGPPLQRTQRERVRAVLDGPSPSAPEQDSRPAPQDTLAADNQACMPPDAGQPVSGVRIETHRVHRSPTPLAVADGDRISVAEGLEAQSAELYRSVLAHEMAHVAQWRRGLAGAGTAWSENRLEAEARRAGSEAAQGNAARIHGVAADRRPRFHPIFISTHGSQGFLRNARRFYTRWGYGTPESVSSMEEIVSRLSAGGGSLDRVTIVSHAVPDNINLSFLRGGPPYVSLDDWSINREEELPQYSGHVTPEDLPAQVLRDAARADADTAALLARLSPDLSDTTTRQFVWWLIDADFCRRVTPRNAIPRRAAVVARIEEYAAFYKRDYERWVSLLASVSSFGVSEGDADLLERAVRRTVRGYRWDPITRANGRAISAQIRSGRERAVERVLTEGIDPADPSPFGLDLMWAAVRFSADSVIEIKGCRIGQNEAYLEAISEFFSALGGPGPRVTAPDMFQIFGYLGYRAQPDSPRRLRALWRNAAVRRAFLFWARELGWPLSDPPAAADLVNALRAGHAFPVGTVLYFLNGQAPGSPAAWFARYGYALSNAPDIEAEFFEGRRIRQAMGYTIVDWLQENRPDQRGGQIILPPDPAYEGHIQEGQYEGAP